MPDRIDFMRWMNARGLSERTKKEYAIYYDLFPYTEFTQENVNQVLQTKRWNNIVARAFIMNYKDFMIDMNPVDIQYPRIRLPRKTGRKSIKLPEYITETELKLIEEAMPSEREKVMILLSFYGGLRADGLLKIRAIDFDWVGWNSNRSLPCKLKVTEKGNKERIVLVPSFVMHRVEQWIKNYRMNMSPGKLLWSFKYRRWHFFMIHASKKALGRRVSPHKLRHGCATWLLNKGWSLQEISEYLGHESISTAQIYAHIDKDRLRNKYADLFINMEQNKH